MVTDLTPNVVEQARDVCHSRAEAWARFWATVDDGPNPAAGGVQADVEDWEAVVDELYRVALALEEQDAEALGADWVSALDDWERWPCIDPVGSRSRLLLTNEP